MSQQATTSELASGLKDDPRTSTITTRDGAIVVELALGLEPSEREPLIDALDAGGYQIDADRDAGELTITEDGQ